MSEKPTPQPNHDALTGLPTRAGLVANLASMVARSPGGFGGLFVDLDDLKITNDTLGHDVGDQLIRDAAQIMRGDIRDSSEGREPDQIGRAGDPYRLGGDEFIVLLAGAKTQEDVEAASRRIRADLEKAGIRASIGGKAHEGESAEQFIKEIDIRMYRDKEARKELEAKRREHEEKMALRREVAKLSTPKLLAYGGAHLLRKVSGVAKLPK
jgi:diguanylate cyclase (GGDEF)-like protein